MEVRKTDYNTEDTILYNLDPYVGKSITISDEAVTADEKTGKKIVKAGTIIGIDGKKANDAKARYVVLQNVDVTGGPRSATAIYKGTVYVTKLPEQPSEAACSALKGIFFMKDDSDYVISRK